MYRSATEPQSIAGVLDSGFKLYAASFAHTFWLAGVAALVALPVSFMSRRYLLGGLPPTDLLVRLGLALLVVAVIGGALNAALIARTDAVAHGGTIPAGEAIALGARRVPALIAVSILYSLALAVGFLLLVVPGFIVSVWWVFAMPVVVTQRLGPFASMGYSRDLVRGHWWRTAVLLTIVVIVMLVVYVAIGLFTGIVAAFGGGGALTPGEVPWYVDFLVGPVMAAVVTPFFYSMFLSIMYDLQVRREGGDLAARIAAAA